MTKMSNGSVCAWAGVLNPLVVQIGDPPHEDMQTDQGQQSRDENAKADDIQVVTLGGRQDPTVVCKVWLLQGFENQRQVPHQERYGPQDDERENDRSLSHEGGVIQGQLHCQAPVKRNQEQGENGANARCDGQTDPEETKDQVCVKEFISGIVKSFPNAHHPNQKISSCQVKNENVVPAWFLLPQLVDDYDHQQIGRGDEDTQDGMGYCIYNAGHPP